MDPFLKEKLEEWGFSSYVSAFEGLYKCFLASNSRVDLCHEALVAAALPPKHLDNLGNT
jgi:hypothetical protein